MSHSEPSEQQLKHLVQVDAAKHYQTREYLAPRRMASVGYQLRFIIDHFKDARILEVGVGTGLTRDLLRRDGFSVTTLDIDADLKPDLLGAITAIPSKDGAFDAFLCCQVLEHIPWEDVPVALAELMRVCPRGGVLSVPTNRPTWLLMKYDSRSWGTRRLVLGSRMNKPLRVPDQHYWELEANRTTKQFEELLKKRGLRILEKTQPVECMYHQFYVVMPQS